jgi:hypothetical protein
MIQKFNFPILCCALILTACSESAVETPDNTFWFQEKQFSAGDTLKFDFYAEIPVESIENNAITLFFSFEYFSTEPDGTALTLEDEPVCASTNTADAYDRICFHIASENPLTVECTLTHHWVDIMGSYESHEEERSCPTVE